MKPRSFHMAHQTHTITWSLRTFSPIERKQETQKRPCAPAHAPTKAPPGPETKGPGANSVFESASSRLPVHKFAVNIKLLERQFTCCFHKGHKSQGAPRPSGEARLRRWPKIQTQAPWVRFADQQVSPSTSTELQLRVSLLETLPTSKLESNFARESKAVLKWLKVVVALYEGGCCHIHLGDSWTGPRQSPHPSALSTEQGFKIAEGVINPARKTWLFHGVFFEEVLVWQLWPILKLSESRSLLTAAFYFQSGEGSGL